ncbi:MAG: bacillithiol biosynthesis deacetylase BshB1 [Candidatus Methanofastidiosia archaeon]
MKIDVLVVGAHPDDSELGVGGTLAKLKARGYKTGIIDLTKGELGSRGNFKKRLKEAERSSEVLGLDLRENLNLGDCKIENSFENGVLLAERIRKLRPSLVFAPYWNDRHPDHARASKLCKRACFMARLSKIELDLDIHSPNQLIYYMVHDTFRPTFIVDITNHFEKKIEALKAFKTQFLNRKEIKNYRFIGAENYLYHTRAKARFYGAMINTQYGEAFLVRDTLRIDDPLKFWRF